MGEPAATKCLALLLQSETRLHAATTNWLSELTGVDLGSVHYFEPEIVQEDLGRPDLSGLDSLGRPVLIVEAKFGAELTDGQLASYLQNQQVKLQGERGAMVVLVPEARSEYAQGVVDTLLHSIPAPSISAVVTTWDAWLDHWDAVVSQDAAEDFDLRSDLNQLRGLVHTMDGLLGLPFAPNSDAAWRQWEPDLAALVIEFTRVVNEVDGYSARDLPTQSSEPGFSPARYVLAARRPTKDAFLYVGLSSIRADEGKSPIWARISQQYAAPVMGALHAHFPNGDEDARGHFWIPIEIPNTVGTERVFNMTEDLLAVKETLQSLY